VKHFVRNNNTFVNVNNGDIPERLTSDTIVNTVLERRSSIF
jgi:hypothetical protein